MKVTVHMADSRGHADHGWLESYHSFSFASYYNPDRVNFGALRVLNDDKITGGQGFGAHPHDNMEIISIPLSGAIQHKDSLGNSSVIKSGEVQVMSAGTGVTHSEFNASPSEEAKFLQIWIIPNKRNVKPRYGQITLKKDREKNVPFLIVSPDGEAESAWIHQQAWLFLYEGDGGQTIKHALHGEKNGLYVFVLEGGVEVGGVTLQKRDAAAINDTKAIELSSIAECKVLLIEVPLG